MSTYKTPVIKAGLVNKYVCLILYITDKNVHITDSLKKEEVSMILYNKKQTAETKSHT